MTDKEATKNLKGQIKCLKCETGIDCEKCRPNWSKEEDIEALDMAIDILENQKTGHWIWEEKIVSETYTDPKEIDYIGWVCDNCHNPPNDYAEWDNPEEKPMYKFCPNCGAKMEK